MQTIIQFLEEEVEDTRQAEKVEHALVDVIVCVLLGTLCNADTLVQIGLWASNNLELLRRWVPLKNGAPSHDTIGRVLELVKPEKFRELLSKWDSELKSADGTLLKQILAIDGKTIRGNGNKNQDPLHVLSIYSREGGVCFGQKSSNSKGKECPMIKELLKMLKLNGHVVTSVRKRTADAIGTNPEVAEAIIEAEGEYVLPTKGNQPNMEADLAEYFRAPKFLEEIKASGNYKEVIERARSQWEKREYYQAEAGDWITRYKEWPKLATIGMVVTTTIRDNGTETVEPRYFISSLKCDIELFARAVRGHWSVEVMHWLLDVVFREDASHILEKNLAENMNIIRKWSLERLKKWNPGKKMSMKNKRYLLSMKTAENIEAVLAC